MKNAPKYLAVVALALTALSGSAVGGASGPGVGQANGNYTAIPTPVGLVVLNLSGGIYYCPSNSTGGGAHPTGSCSTIGHLPAGMIPGSYWIFVSSGNSPAYVTLYNTIHGDVMLCSVTSSGGSCAIQGTIAPQ